MQTYIEDSRVSTRKSCTHSLKHACDYPFWDNRHQSLRSLEPTKFLFSSGKTRGYSDLGSYQSSPSSGPSPQPPSTVARSSTQNAVPSSPSPVSPGGTLLRQPSHFQQQTNPRGWAPVTPPATSPLSQQQPPFPSQQRQPQQQQQTQQPWQVSDARMNVTDGHPPQFWKKSR